MARELGADSLRYLPVEAIARSVSMPPDRLCRACITGNYPSPAGQRLYQLDVADPCHANGAGGIRAYEPSAAVAVPDDE
jgi:amidophosphoribosyltransferase